MGVGVSYDFINVAATIHRSVKVDNLLMPNGKHRSTKELTKFTIEERNIDEASDSISMLERNETRRIRTDKGEKTISHILERCIRKSNKIDDIYVLYRKVEESTQVETEYRISKSLLKEYLHNIDDSTFEIATDIFPVLIVSLVKMCRLKCNYIYAPAGHKEYLKSDDLTFILIAEIDFEQHGDYKSGHWHIVNAGWKNENQHWRSHYALHHLLSTSAPWIWHTTLKKFCDNYKEIPTY